VSLFLRIAGSGTVSFGFWPNAADDGPLQKVVREDKSQKNRLSVILCHGDRITWP